MICKCVLRRFKKAAKIQLRMKWLKKQIKIRKKHRDKFKSYLGVKNGSLNFDGSRCTIFGSVTLT